MRPVRAKNSSQNFAEHKSFCIIKKFLAKIFNEDNFFMMVPKRVFNNKTSFLFCNIITRMIAQV